MGEGEGENNEGHYQYPSEVKIVKSTKGGGMGVE